MSAHRHDFLLPDRGIYALSHSVGCLPRAARAALDAGFFQPWEHGGGDAWPDWLLAIDRFKAALGRLLVASARDFSPQANLSSALSKLLSALTREPGKDVLLTHAESFPSIGFVLDHATGFRRRLLSCASDDAAAWREALDERIAAVVITHVHSNSGAIEPVREIVQRCRELGILSIVDIAQSAGILPVSLADFGADVAIGSCVKWLCGGPGAGFMWVRPEVLPRLAPSDVGWFSHRDPFEFDIRHFEYADDSRRFWGGTPSIAPYVLATHAIEVLQRVGMDVIHSHNRKLARLFLDSMPEPNARQVQGGRGGTLCLALGAHAAGVAAALRAQGHFFDLRETTLRLSFHIYNTEAEARALGQICSTALLENPKSARA